jgi:hypothetical protein
LSNTAEKMTEVILEAWDEIEGEQEEASSGVTEPVASTADEEEAEDEVVPDEEDEEPEEAPEEAGEEEAEEVPEEEAEEEEPSGDEEAPAASVFSSDDPEVKIFLARRGGDIEAALKDGVRFESLVGRQGREMGQLREHNQRLQAELEQVRLFSQDGAYLSEEQRAWVEEAVSSGNALGYIQSAVREGEFDLARAILEQGEFSTVQALKLAQAIDHAEGQVAPVEQEQPLAHDVLMSVLIEHYPEMPRFEAEMVATLQALGPEHPLAALAQSQDPAQAAQGIIGLYEIARAKTATVTSTREEVKQRSRRAAAAVREKAVVSSGSATPLQVQVARRTLMPGLSQEALDAEFDRQAQE